MGPGTLVGRDGELRLLTGLVAEVAAGRGRSVLVEGEPGIGKSALLAAGTADAERLGCQVFWGAADELGQRFPLRVLLDCLGIGAQTGDPLRAEIATLLWGTGAEAVGAENAALAAAERLLTLVDLLCADAPVLLVADDLQWADETSLLVWNRLARAVDQLPLLLVAAMRTVPRRGDLELLRRRLKSRGVAVSLRPLPPGDAAEMITGLLGAPPDRQLRRLAGRAAGNPLYIRELIDSLRRDRKLQVTAETAGLAADTTGAPALISLGAAIANRLDFLSPDAVQVLRLAALLGAEFSATEAALLSGRAPRQLIPVLDEVAAAGVVVTSGARLRFRHPLIRHALYDGMPAALRAALHREAAEALANAGALAARVAEQLLPALPELDDWGLDWLAAAAPTLTFQAPQMAADLLAAALGATPAEDHRREALGATLIAVLFRLGRFAELEQTARPELDRIQDPERAAETAWLLGYALLYLGRYEEALATVQRALDSGTATLDSGTATGGRQARLWALAGMGHSALDRPDEAEAACRRALAVGEQSHDPWAVAFTLHVQSLMAAYQSHNAEVEQLISRALALIDHDPRWADLRIVMRSNRMLARLNLDRTADAEADLLAARELAELTGSRRLHTVHMAGAEHYFRVGRWDDAVAELEPFLEPGRTENATMFLAFTGIAALVAGHRNQWKEARARLAAVAEQPFASAADRNNAGYLFMARALAAEHDGHPDQAHAILAPTLDPAYARGMHLRYLWLPDMVRLALATGDRDGAQAATQTAAAEATNEPTQGKNAAAHRCQALLRQDPALAVTAVTESRACGQPLALAHALEDAAAILAQHDRTGTARTLLGEAMDFYTRLGADWDIIRAEARLRPHRLRRARPTPPRAAKPGWPSLTPTELTVARLVAEGLSNPAIAARLYLSRHTVQTHVSHILAKLGAHSRSEIAHEAAHHDTAPHSGTDPDTAADTETGLK